MYDSHSQTMNCMNLAPLQIYFMKFKMVLFLEFIKHAYVLIGRQTDSYLYMYLSKREKADSFDFLMSNFNICTGHVIAHVAYILFVIHFW